MAEATTTLRLRVIDDGAIATVNNLGNSFTGLTIGTTALSVVFGGLSKAVDSNVVRLALGEKNAIKFSGAIAKIADVNSKALQSFSALSDAAFILSQGLTAVQGVQSAVQAFTRVEQTFALLQSSGVSTRAIEDFYTLTDAVKGSEASLQQFAISAVENLGKFEQAAARAGTILRSSVNFDEQGQALRASREEQLQNAFQVQDIVNKQLKNSVSSTEALVGQYEVLSSGFTDTAQSQQVLAAGLKLIGVGQAGGQIADSGETLRLLTKTLNAYELSASDAAKTAAILNATVENGLTTIQELSIGFGQTAKTAKAAGVDLKDLASSTSVLTTQGINTATALTGLQSVFGAIVSKTPGSIKALQKLSLNGERIRFDLAEIKAKGFTQALIDLNQAAGGNAKILQEIFPEELQFRTVLALLAEDGKKLSNITKSIGSTTASSLDEVFNIATGDRVNRFQQIVNRFQELIIKIASSVVPVFEPGIALLERIASFFSNLPDPVKEAIGQFIVFQITTRSTVAGVGILLQTLGSLASAYLQVRLVSLALSGQLGKEIAVIRELITQRKGLLSVALQLFGIDQRFRLSAEATTKTLEKQNVITKAIAASRNKAGEVIRQNISGLTGQEPSGVIERVKQTAQGAKQSAQNVFTGVKEAVTQRITGVAAPQLLDANGKPLNATGIERVKQEARKVGDAITSGLKEQAGSVQESLPRVQLLGADGKPINTQAIQQKAVETGTAIQSGLEQGKEKALSTASTVQSVISPKKTDSVLAEDKSFIAADKQFQEFNNAAKKAADDRVFALKQVEAAQNQLTKSTENAAQKAIAADVAKEKALFAVSQNAENQQQLLADAIKKRTEAENAALSVTESQNNLIDKQNRLEQVRSAEQKIRTEAQQASIQLEQKYAEATERQTLARRFNSQAISLEEKAILAKANADRLEAIATLSPDDIAAQTAAKQARATATALEEKATQFKVRAELESAAATSAATVANEAAILAEQGLAKARIFGRDVTFSTTGPIGALNKLLATEISLKGTLAIASKTASVSLGILTTSFKVLGAVVATPVAGIAVFIKSLSQLSGSGLLSKVSSGIDLLTAKLAGQTGVNLLSGAASGLAGLFKGVGGAITALLGPLGLIAPVLGAVALGAVIFRKELFGLGKDVREASKQFNQFLKEYEELERRLGTGQKLLEFQAQFKTGETKSTQEVEQQLVQLQLNGDLTTQQFNKLRDTLREVGKEGTLAGADLEKFRSQIEAVRKGAKGTPEKGVFDQTGDLIKGGFKNIGKGFDGIVNFAGQQLFLPTDISKSIVNRQLSFTNVSQDREAASILTSLGDIGTGLDLVGSNSLATAQKINQYNQALGLTEETNQKIGEGIKLTAADFERENTVFEAQKQRNESAIAAINKQIEEYTKQVAKTEDPQLKATFQGRIDLLRQETTTLEKRNQALKDGQSQFVKYFQETLPALKRAITETTNFSQNLNFSADRFRQQFVVGADGKPTAFNKDITTLRNEAVQFADAIGESFQAGELSTSQAAQNLREIRDSQITASGVTGFRFNTKDRIEQTRQIVEFEQKASKERQDLFQLDAERAKLLQTQRIAGEEETQAAIAQINIKTLEESLAQKQIEINEFAKFPIRKAELEREAAKIRIQIEQSVAQEDARLLNQSRQQRQAEFDIEVERIRTLQAQRVLSADEANKRISAQQIAATRQQLKDAEEDLNLSGGRSVKLQQQVTQLRLKLAQQEAAELDRIIQLEEKRQQLIIDNAAQLQKLLLNTKTQGLDNTQKDLELNQQLSQASNEFRVVQEDAGIAQLKIQQQLTGDIEKRAQLETQVAQTNLDKLKLTQQQERESLAIQVRINELQIERQQLQLQGQRIDLQSARAKLDQELTRAIREKRTPEELKQIQLQIQANEQQVDFLGQQELQLNKQASQQQQIALINQRQLDLKQNTATAQEQLNFRLAKQREFEASIEKAITQIGLQAQEIEISLSVQSQKNEAITKGYEAQKNVLQAQQDIFSKNTDRITTELGIAKDLTNSAREQRDIAQAIAGIKLKALDQQIALERQVLELNLKQKDAQLQQEKGRNLVAQTQNAAEISKAQAELAKVRSRPTATPEEIRAAELGLRAQVEKGVSLRFESILLDQQGVQNQFLGQVQRQQFEQSATLRQRQADVEFANTLSPRQRRRALRNIRNEALTSALGTSDRGEQRRAISGFNRSSEVALLGGAIDPQRQFAASRINNQLNQPLPGVQTNFTDFEAFREQQLNNFASAGVEIPQFTEATTVLLDTLRTTVDKLTNLVNEKLSNPANVSQDIQITNNFTGTDKNAADTITQQIRKQLIDLGTGLSNK